MNARRSIGSTAITMVTMWSPRGAGCRGQGDERKSVLTYHEQTG